MHRERKCAENYNINNTINAFSKTAITILPISNRKNFRALFDKIASVRFISKIYFIVGKGRPREPTPSQLYRRTFVHGRPHIGANGVSWPPGKMDEKLKSENMQKRAVVYVYVILWEQSGQACRCRERRYADHTFIQIYFRMHHFCSQIFENFFASGGKGALTP